MMWTVTAWMLYTYGADFFLKYMYFTQKSMITADL